MPEFEIWIYRGLIAALFLIVGWVVKLFATKVFDKFDELIQAVNALSSQYAAHEGQIKQVVDLQADHSNRLNDHGGRIRTLEIEHAKGCKVAK